MDIWGAAETSALSCDFSVLDVLDWLALGGAGFDGTGFEGAGFDGTVFFDAGFVGAVLVGAGFAGAGFAGAVFVGAVFVGAGFDGAVFVGAGFAGAGFVGAVFVGADLVAAGLVVGRWTPAFAVAVAVPLARGLLVLVRGFGSSRIPRPASPGAKSRAKAAVDSLDVPVTIDPSSGSAPGPTGNCSTRSERPSLP